MKVQAKQVWEKMHAKIALPGPLPSPTTARSVDRFRPVAQKILAESGTQSQSIAHNPKKR